MPVKLKIVIAGVLTILAVDDCRPSSPATPRTRSRCMNTLSSVSKKSGAK